VQLPGGAGTASSGQPQFIEPLARAAAAVGVDGIFVEVHDAPERALSDGPQSLDFAGFGKVMRALTEPLRPTSSVSAAVSAVS